MKKNILAIIPLSIAFLLSGCGAGDEEEKPVDAGTIRDKVVHITLKTSGSQQQVATLNRYKDAFREIEPNIRVKIEQVGGSYKGIAETTISELNTSHYGDLVVMYPDAIATCIEFGRCYDLTKYIENPEYGLGDEIDDYIPEYLAEGQKYVRKGVFSMPFQKSTEVMFYNEEVLGDMIIPGVNGGLPITETYFADMTWEKLFTEFCPAVDKYAETHPDFIKKGENGSAILGIDSDENMFITLAEQYGLPYTNVDKQQNEGLYEFDTKEMRDIMLKWNEYYQKGWICTQKTIGKDGVRPNNLFTQKSCLLSIGSTAGIKYQWDEKAPLTVIPNKLPHAEGHDAKVISQGPSMAFLRHKVPGQNTWDTHRQLASWLFYKFITSSELATDWAVNAKYLPIRTSAAESDAYQEFVDPSTIEDRSSYEALFARTNQLVINDIDDAEYFTSYAFDGSQKCRTEIGNLFKNCLITKEANATKIANLFTDTLNEVRV